MNRRITRLAGALAAMGLAAGLTIGGMGTARADLIPPSGTWSEIFNPYLHTQGITLCADDPNGSTANGQPLQLFRCHGYASNGAPQRWVFVPITDSNDIPCAAASNFTDNNSTRLVIEDCVPSDTRQLWNLG